MSHLILMSGRDRIPLRDVARLVLKLIFEKDNCGVQTVNTINRQIDLWYKLVKTQKEITAKKYGLDSSDFLPVGKKGSVIDEIEFFLQIMASWLVKDEQGEFEGTKATYREHKIDYRKTARFGWLYPELYDAKGKAKAREYLLKAMKDHPEDYN